MPLPSRPVLTRRYIWYILSIGLCYTGSLLCSNMAYLTLSVSFISMLKSLAPVTTLVISYAGGFSDPTPGKWAKIFVITFGVFLSSVGEVTFAWDGFLYQMFGTVSESVRLLLIDWLLAIPAAADSTGQESKRTDEGYHDAREQHSSSEEGEASPVSDREAITEESTQDKTRDDVEAQRGSEGNGMAAISPLVLLYYYAPVCAVFNLMVALMTEWRTFNAEDLHRVGWSMLALNGAVAFMLNVSSVFLVCNLHSCAVLFVVIHILTRLSVRLSTDWQDICPGYESHRHTQVCTSRLCGHCHLEYSHYLPPGFWICYCSGRAIHIFAARRSMAPISDVRGHSHAFGRICCEARQPIWSSWSW